MLLPTTLCLAAAAGVINVWLSMRVTRLRMSSNVLFGDGGNDILLRRMRAHANFIENTPLALILCAAIELSDKGGRWLAIVGAVFMLARLGHAIGMDQGKPNAPRAIGAMITMATLLGLSFMAVLIAIGRF